MNFTPARFQFVHDVVDHLLQCEQAGRPFLKRLGDARGKLAPVERFVSSPIALDHSQIGSLNLFVSREPIFAAQTLATTADTGTIPRLPGIDDLVITRPALGATHSMKGLSSTLFVVASILLSLPVRNRKWLTSCSGDGLNQSPFAARQSVH